MNSFHEYLIPKLSLEPQYPAAQSRTMPHFQTVALLNWQMCGILVLVNRHVSPEHPSRLSSQRGIMIESHVANTTATDHDLYHGLVEFL